MNLTQSSKIFWHKQSDTQVHNNQSPLPKCIIPCLRAPSSARHRPSFCRRAPSLLPPCGVARPSSRLGPFTYSLPARLHAPTGSPSPTGVPCEPPGSPTTAGVRIPGEDAAPVFLPLHVLPAERRPRPLHHPQPTAEPPSLHRARRRRLPIPCIACSRRHAWDRPRPDRRASARVMCSCTPACRRAREGLLLPRAGPWHLLPQRRPRLRPRPPESWLLSSAPGRLDGHAPRAPPHPRAGLEPWQSTWPT